MRLLTALLLYSLLSPIALSQSQPFLRHRGDFGRHVIPEDIRWDKFLEHQTDQAPTTKVTAKLFLTLAESRRCWWSPDSQTLAVQGNSIALYDTATGKVRVEIKYEQSSASPLTVHFTPDSKQIIIHTDRICIHRVSDGKLLREFATGTLAINEHKVAEITYDPSDTSTYSPPSKEDRLQWLPSQYESDRIMSPDAKSILAGTEDGKVQVYDVSTGTLKLTLEHYVPAGKKKDDPWWALGEFSVDGRFIVTAYGNRTPRLWDASTGELIANLGPQTDKVFAARFSLDSKFVATSSFDGVVNIWDAGTGKLKHTIGSRKDRAGSKKERTYFAVWNPKNNTFVTKSRNWDVKIWNAENGALICALDNGAIKEKFDSNQIFDYSPDGKILATHGKNSNDLRWMLSAVSPLKKKPGSIAHLWNAETGSLIASLRDNKVHDEHFYEADKFFWSPTGRFLVTAGPSVKLWNNRGELMQELAGNAMSGASLSYDGKLLVVTGDSMPSIGSTIIEVSKLMIGKLPKDVPQKTYVWQIDDSQP